MTLNWVCRIIKNGVVGARVLEQIIRDSIVVMKNIRDLVVRTLLFVKVVKWRVSRCERNCLPKMTPNSFVLGKMNGLRSAKGVA